MGISIEPLGKRHDRRTFCCGQPELDDWFRHRASQDEKRNLTRVFVACDDELGVVGFYSLSSFTLAIGDLPEEISRKLARYDAIPAALIGRLARHEGVRGKGMGELLLVEAIRRTLAAGQSLAVFAIVVDAKDQSAVSFYKEFGFQQFPLRLNRLFLTTPTAMAALSKT